MAYKAPLLGSTAALLAGMVASVQAAPTVSPGPMSAEVARLEQIAARCWWRHGKRHCVYRSHSYRDRYREHGVPEKYRTGSARWWEEMERTDRAGRRR